MLIIFDLDDTLIDTQGSITPVALRHTFFKMIEKGLGVKDWKKEFKYLLDLNKHSMSSKETLKKFLKKHRAFDEFFEFAVNEMQARDFSKNVLARKGVKNILKELKIFHKLALVTIGKEDLQKKKLKNAGIDSSFFCTIKIVNKNKKVVYQKIIEKMRILPTDVVVCGDKIGVDLKPAKLLGFTTIHMQWGRGLNDKDEYGIIDYKINELEEIKKIIDKIGESND